jgi:NAD(P)H-hydrate repair Nnr-like enzyme with NAD(P)H-hydrate epimerase domain
MEKGLIRTVSYINSKLAKEIDDLLMGELGFSSQQLMELAGLSIANLVHHKISTCWKKSEKILVLSGPGSKNYLFLKF